MPVDLSIKNVPDPVARRLKRRAARNRRSLQGELLSILEDAVPVRSTPLSPLAVLEKVRRLGIQTAPEAAAMIRADRDRGH
ncbi:MAG: FitA-like ribbon-helix-helix domain-containing protein [Rhodospirillales bacterium]